MTPDQEVLRVLLLEDSPLDAELIVRELRRAGIVFVHEQVDTEAGLIDALARMRPQVVLSDNALPGLDALGALELVRHHQADTSFIVVSGTLGEEVAIQMLKSGVTDYVLKHRLERLPPVVLRAVKEAEEHRAVVRAEEASRKADERFRRAFEDAAIGMALIRPDGGFFQVNRELCDLLGRSDQELLGLSLDDITHPDDRPPVPLEFTDSASFGPRGHRHERRLLHADGSIVWVLVSVSMMDATSDEAAYGVAQFVDITAAQTAQAQLVDQALHDSLTGLPNRALVKDRLTAALAREHTASSIAVFHIDLDRFKEINDSLGHKAGDRLLRAVADRLRRVISASDTVARLSGDEFVLVCEDLRAPQEAAAIADRVVDALTAPFAVGNIDVTVTASVGIAFAIDSGITADDLIRDADLAMFGAKQRGGNRFEVFNEAMRDRLIARHEVNLALQQAVRRGELRAYYQPQVSLVTGQLVGYEALVRWQHPVRGLLAPVDFLDVAEESGRIVEIGEWILRQTCIETMASETPDDIVVSVNLSARQLAETAVLETILRILDDTGLDPRRLCLEITETALLVTSERTSATFADLRKRGVLVAVDDFGTGYASLSYLAEFRPDILKIDKSFVQAIETDPLSSAIVSAVVNLGRSQQITVVAEGIETREQAAILRRMGCPHAQGYLFGRPQADMLSMKWLERRQSDWRAVVEAAVFGSSQAAEHADFVS